MTGNEKTSSVIPAEEVGGIVFSTATREQALKLLEKSHGGIVTALSAPAKNMIAWFIGDTFSATQASNIIDARKRFNDAANDAVNPDSEVLKNSA